MPSKKPSNGDTASASSRNTKASVTATTAPTTKEAVSSALATVSGPSTAQADPAGALNNAQRRVVRQKAGAQALAQAMPYNAAKPGEFGAANAKAPPTGATVTPADLMDTASTTTEGTSNDKVGTMATPGHNAGNEPLDRVRVDSGARPLTTNMGLAIGDNQNSLKAGLRGPTLLEDFVLREKITHFDHERIPERIVHARGSAAHGVFEVTKAIPELTKAGLFAQVGKTVPVFVRFSTVAGERGAADLTRDVRGFAVKFYTDEGNWDIVGNNIPVFFIQDGMKFPDLIHAAKPEPNNGMPQGATAHDTFWDFASLSPETAHMLLWVMSDRALPRSYRTMQGFGVHTFRLVNAQGEATFVKFHWVPVAGTHSVVWDEAVKINGMDSDFHRRDLWEGIEAGVFPEYDLCIQTFTEAQAETFSFDILDATKLVPEELVPLVAIGRLTLNRNPDNFFAETEQVAFNTANVIPGIDFSNDPLLASRHHSYLDTQLSRLGGPNFHEIPINSPVAQVHNNQRDGIHRQAIPRGRVAYEPNSLAGGCPFQAGAKGFVSFPAPVNPQIVEDKVRGKPEKFADHFSQATLFWNSQTPVEKDHIVGAFRFELTRVQVQAIRERTVSLLANVADELAQRVADGLGIPVPAPQPTVLGHLPQSELASSTALSMFARPGDGSIAGRRVALLVCDGVDGASLRAVKQALTEAGAVPRFLGARLGTVLPAAGTATDGKGDGSDEAAKTIHVEITTETSPSPLWDAVVLPGGAAAQAKLLSLGAVREFVRDQYRHCKPILVLGEGLQLLQGLDLSPTLPDGSDDPGIVVGTTTVAATTGGKGKAGKSATADGSGNAATAARFVAAIARHRHFERETDPALV